MKQVDYVLVYVTAPVDRAAELARLLVEQGVAACVNIVERVQAIYRWQGELCSDQEALLIIKTHAARFESLKQLVIEHHPYEVPEIIGVPVAVGSEAYLRWIDESLSAKA